MYPSVFDPRYAVNPSLEARLRHPCRRRPRIEHTGAPQINVVALSKCHWGLITDHSGLGEWSIFDGKVLREGTDSVNRPGCLRELKGFGGAMKITEQIEPWEPDEIHYTYKLLSGAPFKKHRGGIYVTENKVDSVKVRWAIRFDS